jgi:hypothetical protein
MIARRNDLSYPSPEWSTVRLDTLRFLGDPVAPVHSWPTMRPLTVPARDLRLPARRSAWAQEFDLGGWLDRMPAVRGMLMCDWEEICRGLAECLLYKETGGKPK